MDVRVLRKRNGPIDNNDIRSKVERAPNAFPINRRVLSGGCCSARFGRRERRVEIFFFRKIRRRGNQHTHTRADTIDSLYTHTHILDVQNERKERSVRGAEMKSTLSPGRPKRLGGRRFPYFSVGISVGGETRPDVMSGVGWECTKCDKWAPGVWGWGTSRDPDAKYYSKKINIYTHARV